MADTRLADISEFQPNLDADAYLAGGHRCIIIRAHNGTRPDNIWPARRDYVRQFPFVAVGYYQYLKPNVDADAQARAFIAAVGQLHANEFPICDAEEGAGSQVARVEAWFRSVDAWAGFPATLYAGESFGNTNLGGWARWAGRPRWIAAYRASEPSAPHEFWQNTDKGSFPGLAGGVDGSIFHGTAEQFLTTVRRGQLVAPPVEQEDENMITSEVSVAGNMHVFVATEDAVFYTWQAGNSTDWSGAAGGLPAGLARFCTSVDNKKIAGITAKVAANGVFHLFVRFRDGTTAATWQRPNETSWSGGAPGKGIAGLSYLASKP